jgi:hypothetical protein
MQEILTQALGQIAPTLIASLIQMIRPSSAMIANLASKFNDSYVHFASIKEETI